MARVENLLGLAKKAGKVKSGEFCTENSIKSGHASLVIMAEDVSDNTAKKFNNMCSFRSIPLIRYRTKESLGACIGENIRSVASVEDPGFAQAMQKAAGTENLNRGADA